MPDYKKKKHKGFIPKSKVLSEDFQINVGSKKSITTDKPTPRVIKGNKEKRIGKIKILFAMISFLLIVILISGLIFPVGIIETFSNFTLSIGSGEFPVKLNGSKAINVSENDNYYYVLTDLSLYSVTNSGMVINTVGHGFSNPILKTSKTRALLYDQGEKNVEIYKVNKKIITTQLKFNIICADISNSGIYAIATLSDAYASTVTVYNKSGDKIYTWNCAKDTINAISLSPNGKKIAVSTVNANNGEFSSKLHIFNLKKTDSENSIEYSNETIYSTYANGYGIFVVTNKGYDFVKWSDGSKQSYKSDLSVNFLRVSSSGAIAVVNRKSDRSDNKIYFLSKKGKTVSEFSFSGNISDIRQKGSHIYLISDAQLIIFNKNGEKLSSKACEHDYRYLVPAGSYNCNIISDNQINSLYVK